MRIISFERAAQLATVLFGAVILFHIVILIGIIFFDYAPVDFLWGGRMETKDELLVFEFLSVLVSVFCLITVLIRSGRINAPGLQRVTGVVLWLLFVLFVLNTVGNLLAKTTFENFFAIITAMLALLCLRLGLRRVN